MKHLLLTSLAVLLVMSSLGNAFAAALCPRGLGRECCFAKTQGHTHKSPPAKEDLPAHCMHMEGMSMTETNDGAMEEMAMDGMSTNATVVDDVSVPASATDAALAERLDQPVSSCPHCLTHSGPANAPLSFVTVTDQSGKDFNSVPLPVSKFPVRPAITLIQDGLPREHAPPGTSAPRHLLISVFLI